MAKDLNTLDRDNLMRVISRLTERVNYLERLFQGQPIGDVRIASLSASKLTAGILTALVAIGSAEKIVIDGANNRILIYDDTDTPRILIGYDENGF